MKTLKIEYLPKEELKAYCNNAKLHPAEQVEQIKNSIREFGFNDPIAVWHDNEIIEGHGRLLAAMEMDEIEQVPVIRLDELTDEQRRAYMLAHNKLTMNTDFTPELLELELLNIDIDMSQFGFDFNEVLEEEEQKAEREKRIESMELKAFEHYDYVVFVFKNQMDWLNVVNEFDIKKVDAGYGTTKKVGVGRVIDGKRLLQKIGYQDSDFEQGQE